MGDEHESAIAKLVCDRLDDFCGRLDTLASETKESVRTPAAETKESVNELKTALEEHAASDEAQLRDLRHSHAGMRGEMNLAHAAAAADRKSTARLSQTVYGSDDKPGLRTRVEDIEKDRKKQARARERWWGLVFGGGILSAAALLGFVWWIAQTIAARGT